MNDQDAPTRSGFDQLAEDLADRRRRYLDDAGFPVCPDCGARTLADGLRTCPRCAEGMGAAAA